MQFAEFVTAFFFAALTFLLVGGATWFWSGRRGPDKVDRWYTDFWGRKHKVTKHRGGKKVDRVWRSDRRGRTVKETYIRKKCFNCKTTIRPDKAGWYRCPRCGNTFR